MPNLSCVLQVGLELVPLAILGRGGSEADEADLGTLARLMLWAIVSPGAAQKSVFSCRWLPSPSQLYALRARLPARPPAHLGSCPHCSEPLCLLAPAPWQLSPLLGTGKLPISLLLRKIRCLLFESATSGSLDRQLVSLRQRCGSGGSSSAASSLPTAAQLQAACAALIARMAPVASRESLPDTELAAFIEQAGTDLLALQPDNPRTSFELGKAAYTNATSGSASHLRDPLAQFWRGAELARAQGSDFWLARWAGRLLQLSELGCRVRAEGLGQAVAGGPGLGLSSWLTVVSLPRL